MDKEALRKLIDDEVRHAERVDLMPAACVVRVVPWTQGWELHIEGQGVTQVGDLADIEVQVRSWLATTYDGPADHVTVTVSDESLEDFEDRVSVEQAEGRTRKFEDVRTELDLG